MAFHEILRSLNPAARMLLTVSPVPLIATASPEHVLVATTYSKCVLRAAAGSLAERLPDCHYFPSFEIIASHPSRAMFFDPDLRTVSDRGVDFVMEHFFRAIGEGAGAAVSGDSRLRRGTHRDGGFGERRRRMTDPARDAISRAVQARGHHRGAAPGNTRRAPRAAAPALTTGCAK